MHTQLLNAIQEPGLTPKAIQELFNVLDRDSGKYSFAVSAYMLELYQDDLADLLLPPPKQPMSGTGKVRPLFLARLLHWVICREGSGKHSFVVSATC